MSRNLPTVSSVDPDQSDPSTPTSLTGSYESPPITPTPLTSSFNANNTPSLMMVQPLTNSNFDFGSQIQFDLENIRIKPDNHQVQNCPKLNYGYPDIIAKEKQEVVINT